MFFMAPGPNGPVRLAGLVAHMSQTDQLRSSAVASLGWRKDATASQKDVALAYLLPRLGDANTRAQAAEILHPR